MPDLSPMREPMMAASSGRPDGGEGVVGQFDDIEVAGFKCAEFVGEEVEFLACGLGQLVAGCLVGDGEIDLDVARAG